MRGDFKEEGGGACEACRQREIKKKKDSEKEQAKIEKK